MLPEVAEALERGRPIVALETAVLTHGLPREPLGERPRGADAAWRPDAPVNLEVARLLERIVAAEGAVPATMAVVRGELWAGLDSARLEALAADRGAGKAAARDIAAAIAGGRSAGLTVAGTLAACAAVERSGGAAIRVFATGGIGGAHHGWAQSGDISADLMALARTPVAVVCAGAKSILDLAATLEMLDSLGVPVVGHGTARLPRFISRSGPDLALPCRLDDERAIAALCAAHWELIGAESAVLVMQEPPSEVAVDAALIDAARRDAESSEALRGVRGPEVTPRLLAAIASRTEGRSLSANIGLLIENARLAARLASAMVGLSGPP
ncbi:MAG TPA: pseudouridine-5'-phosphate glycosidase [Phycisphaerales bacterium]|nr:pseudouridine-5'-phosphate glycosidase [Phycisphaerales bacterium]HMP36405.1 pseudouridine-5'-phosphate glycosidase [Phycisphaerales bacterium]